MEKALLILDVDETLIYATETKLEIEEDCLVFDYYIYERPHLDNFIKEVQQYYKLAIWSSASDDYVEEVVNKSSLSKYDFKFIWGRSRATYRRNREIDDMRTYDTHSSHYHYVKDLKKVKKLDYDLDRVLIVDDSPHKSKLNYGNAIYPISFEGNQDDDELNILAKYLYSIKDCKNFRRIEKRNWRSKVNK